METMTFRERFEMTCYIKEKTNGEDDSESLHLIEDTLCNLLNGNPKTKMITTKEVATEIQRRLKVENTSFDNIKLRYLINRAFDWLVEREYLSEIHLN